MKKKILAVVLCLAIQCTNFPTMMAMANAVGESELQVEGGVVPDQTERCLWQ